MTMPVIISYYTENSPYEQEAERLIESLRVLGLRHFVVPEPSKGSWLKNCAHKSVFIQRTLKELKEPVLWLDADATVEKYPVLFDTLDVEFAARHNGTPNGKLKGTDGRGQLLSGTLYFKPCIGIDALLKRWCELCKTTPGVWDQRLLAAAWDAVPVRRQPSFCWLPQGYCKIFDAKWREKPRVEYIRHHQASRRLRRKVR